ncbi:MAG TPA: hypothetical protein VJB11_00090 [archaeon]|nr:hypothetical protein [archaeon]
MLFNSTGDWKSFLSVEDEKRLNELLERVSKYRGSYKNAPDVKTAQMWCTILELRKENIILQKRLDKLMFILDGMFERIREQERSERKLIESLERF